MNKKLQFIKDNKIIRFKILWPFVTAKERKKIYKKYENIFVKKIPHVKPPFIILSNHSVSLDPWIICSSSRQVIYSVMSENLLRLPKMKDKINKYYPGIPKKRACKDFFAIKKIITLLKNKQNILIFPEAKLTSTGVTDYFDNSTVRLAKKYGASIITYKIRGGYFSEPVWGELRKGAYLECGPVNVYKAEDIKDKSVEELYNCVKQDLYENAFETQKSFNTRFSGNNFATGITKMYSICPKCNQRNVIETNGNDINCKNCGPLTTINEYGFFENKTDFFPSTIEWNTWEEQFYANLYKQAQEKEILCQEDVCIIRKITNTHEAEVLTKGQYVLYKDHFEVISDTTTQFKFADIQDVFLMVMGRGLMEFSSHKNEYFEIILGEKGQFSNLVLLFYMFKQFKKDGI